MSSNPNQRRRKVFKSSGAITYERIFNGAIFSKLDSKASKKWWCHGTTGTTAYDGAVSNLHLFKSGGAMAPLAPLLTTALHFTIGP